MSAVTKWLFSGIWWIDALRVWGILFAALLFGGLPIWMVGSKWRWRRRDAADIAAHEERIRLARGLDEKVGAHREP